MKLLILLLLVTSCSTISMDHPENHRQAQNALGSLVTHADRPIVDLLEEIGLLSPSRECAGCNFDSMFQDEKPYNLGPLPPIPPFTTKEERKAKKKQDHTLLWSHAWEVIIHKENLNQTLSDLPEFRNQTLATAAAEHTCHQPILALIFTNGANPNAPDAWKHTPLEAAVSTQRAKNVTFLFSRGANIGSLKLLHKLCNPSQDVIRPGKAARVKTLQALLAAKVDPNETGDQGSTVLEFLLRYCCGKKNFWKTTDAEKLNAQFLQQRKNMITLLLDAGLLPHKTNNAGKTALDLTHEYPSQYHPELIEFLKTEIQKREVKS